MLIWSWSILLKRSMRYLESTVYNSGNSKISTNFHQFWTMWYSHLLSMDLCFQTCLWLWNISRNSKLLTFILFQSFCGVITTSIMKQRNSLAHQLLISIKELLSNSYLNQFTKYSVTQWAKIETIWNSFWPKTSMSFSRLNNTRRTSKPWWR